MTETPKAKAARIAQNMTTAVERHRLLRASLDLLDAYDRGHNIAPSIEAMRELVDACTTPPPPRRKTAKRNQRKR
jgi:hypothetical protein